MIPETSVLVTSIKTAYDIAKGISSIKSELERNEAISKVTEVLRSVQQDALLMYEKHSLLLHEKDAPAKKLMEFEKWDKTASQYELKELAPGILAYIRKKNSDSGDPVIWICPYCYDKKEESFLQLEYDYGTSISYFCPNRDCKTSFRYGVPGRGHKSPPI